MRRRRVGDAKGYRLEVSSDGSTFRPYSEGEFAAAQAGKLNRLDADRRPRRERPAGAPDAALAAERVRRLLRPRLHRRDRARGVRRGAERAAVRLAGRDAGGRGAPASRSTLDASSFNDPDSLITGYDWDFDGDGNVDRRQLRRRRRSPTTRPARYKPTVRAKDFRGGAGTASTTVTVAAPPASPGTRAVAAGARRRGALPVIAIARSGSKGRFTLQVTCAARCELSGKLTVTRKVARRLGRARQTLRTARAARSARPGGRRSGSSCPSRCSRPSSSAG